MLAALLLNLAPAGRKYYYEFPDGTVITGAYKTVADAIAYYTRINSGKTDETPKVISSAVTHWEHGQKRKRGKTAEKLLSVSSVLPPGAVPILMDEMNDDDAILVLLLS